METHFKCFWVEQDASGNVTSRLTSRPITDLPTHSDGQECVKIAVEMSSLNYKDALAANGHSGIVRKFPHIPGIDAVGKVTESAVESVTVGDDVLVTGYDLGVGEFGAWSEHIRVPESWIVPMPPGMTAREAMALGTAGFTAAQCVLSLIEHGVAPDSGPVAVTGATGGVGSLSTRLLAKLGYEVIAVSGKAEQHEQLKQWGAADVIARNEFIDESARPLLKAKFAGAVDTVGGQTLETLLRTTRYRGCITACGLTGGHELKTTVYPFLLRGITLSGIDSAMCPMPHRREIWKRLAGDWKLDGLESMSKSIPMDDLPSAVEQILAGKNCGRVVVAIA